MFFRLVQYLTYYIGCLIDTIRGVCQGVVMVDKRILLNSFRGACRVACGSPLLETSILPTIIRCDLTVRRPHSQAEYRQQPERIPF